MTLRTFLLAALSCLFVTSCTGPLPDEENYGLPPGERPSAATFCKLLSPKAQGLDTWESFRAPLLQSLTYVNSRPQNTIALRYADVSYTWQALRQSIEELIELLPLLKNDPALLARRFSWIPISPPTLLTGYFEPDIKAALTYSPDYPYPLYGVPGDLKKNTAYYDRKAIDQEGALKGRNLEIAWLKNPVDAFFLQVQGSGRLSLPDGSSRHVLYAANNGQPYVSLGKVCIERGLATRETMSMQTLRKILSADAQRRDALLACNPRYIFFKLAEDGPFGASGAKLTPMASAAVDRAFLPLGAILAADALLPQPNSSEMRRFSALLFAQDTGAFKGNHVDLFCGHKREASFLAGNMRGKARFWILVSKKNAQ